MGDNVRSFPRTKILGALVATCVIFNTADARAIPYTEAVTRNALTVLDTFLGNLTASQEADMINDTWDEWRTQREQAGQNSVGQIGIDGLFPLATYTSADLGSTEMLTYFFIDPVTGQRTQPGPPVSAVRYEALLQPPTLDPNQLTFELIIQNVSLIGISTDASTDFAVPFLLTGFEPLILAFPFDSEGQEITGEGTAAFASHVIPEPSTMVLLSLGVLALSGFSRPAAAGQKPRRRWTTR
ncbi:MAG: PEP-CTERM sorting domain-containing protein [Vicinamibacteria bacterium]